MILHNSTAQEIPVQVRIDLRSGDRGVSQHLLYSPEVCTALYQVCGKGMSESMRTDGFFEADSSSTGLDNVENHHAG